LGLRLLRRSLLALSGLALAACGTHAGRGVATTTTGVTSTTAPGQIIYSPDGIASVAVASIPTNLNPLTPAGSNAVTAEVMANVWPSPWVVGWHLPPTTCAGGGLNCGAVITKAEVISTAPMVVSYSIDPRATWSDGVPITSDDFIAEWHAEQSVGTTLPSTNPLVGYEDIAAISPPAARSFTVRFTTPFADWQALFSPLVPAHVANADGWEGAFRTTNAAAIPSGGPFRIARVTRSEIILTRNPSYWGPPAGLARLVFKVEPSTDATLKALRSGAVDVAVLPPSPALDRLVQADQTLSAETLTSPVLEQLAFNLADPTVGELALRQAVAKMIDRHQLLADSYGLVTPFVSVVGNRLFLSGAPGSQGNDGQYQQIDLEESETLLAGLGYHLDDAGIERAPNGSALTLHLLGVTGSPLVASIESELQAELLLGGIRLQVTNVSMSRLLGQLLPTGRYQMALAPYLLSPYPSTNDALYSAPVGPTPPPAAGTTGASGATGVSGSGANATVASSRPLFPAGPHGVEPSALVAGSVTRDVLGFEDPAITSLFAEAATDLNANADSSLYNEIDNDLWSSLPTIPLFELPETLVTRADLDGVSVAQSRAGALWNAAAWAIQTSPPVTTSTSP
jgi:peptide/nickel transport system substrate-binding protein